MPYLAKEFFINRKGQFKVTRVVVQDPLKRIVILGILENKTIKLYRKLVSANYIVTHLYNTGKV